MFTESQLPRALLGSALHRLLLRGHSFLLGSGLVLKFLCAPFLCSVLCQQPLFLSMMSIGMCQEHAPMALLGWGTSHTIRTCENTWAGEGWHPPGLCGSGEKGNFKVSSRGKASCEGAALWE